MNEQNIQQAALQFGKGTATITALSDGLINKTYLVRYSGEDHSAAIVLQCINRSTFNRPEDIIHNYQLIENYLRPGKTITIPSLVTCQQGEWFWTDAENNFWRATLYIPNSYTVLIPASSEQAYTAALCFGRFTRALAAMDAGKLKVILPGFHDLLYRYRQFEEAIKKAGIERLLKATHVIAELRQRKNLVDFFNSLHNNPSYPVRVMHHDCKMSNILLDKTTQQAICPIDLDTVMPGYFFSDPGDMIRSMAATADENSTRWEDIDIRKDFYEAIIKGYLEGMGDALTDKEKAGLHYAGLLLIYMQSLRFVTDFLTYDTYYQTTYPEQNLNRALNQLILLEKLEVFLKTEAGGLKP